MTKDKIQDSKKTLANKTQIETETDIPNYKNWDYSIFIKNNPNASTQEIRTFLRQKRFDDFMMFGK